MMEENHESTAPAPESRSNTLTVGIIAIMVMMVIFILITINFVKIQMADLNKSLGVINKTQEGNKSLHMLVKYLTIHQNQSQKESEESYLSEMMWQSSLPEYNNEILEQSIQTEPFYDQSTRWVISGIRLLIGKSIEKKNQLLFDNVLLQRAYVYERMRKYDQALIEINQYLVHFPNNTLQDLATIGLHQAYCEAQQGNYQNALNHLKRVVEYPLTPDNPTTHQNDTQETAKQLYGIIAETKADIESVEKGIPDPLERGIYYFKLGAYERSITDLNLFKSTVNDILPYSHILKLKCDAIIQANFYIARCYEEMGKADKYLEYADLVKRSDGDNGRFTNLLELRDVLAANVYKSDDAAIVDRAKLTQEKNKDSDFMKKAEQFINTDERLRSGMGTNGVPAPQRTLPINYTELRETKTEFDSSKKLVASTEPVKAKTEPPKIVKDVAPTPSASPTNTQNGNTKPVEAPVAKPVEPPKENTKNPPPTVTEKVEVRPKETVVIPTQAPVAIVVEPTPLMNTEVPIATILETPTMPPDDTIVSRISTNLENTIDHITKTNEVMDAIDVVHVTYAEPDGTPVVKELIPLERQNSNAPTSLFYDPKTQTKILLPNDAIIQKLMETKTFNKSEDNAYTKFLHLKNEPPKINE